MGNRANTGHMLALLLPVKLDFMLNLKSILSHVLLKRMPTCWNILIISRNSLWKSFFSTFSYLFVHVIFNVVVSYLFDVRKLNYFKFIPGLRLANCLWLPLKSNSCIIYAHLSEAHFGGEVKFKSVNKSVEVVRLFPKSGLHSDLVEEIVFGIDCLYFVIVNEY